MRHLYRITSRHGVDLVAADDARQALGTWAQSRDQDSDPEADTAQVEQVPDEALPDAIEAASKALRDIESLKPQPFAFPADWTEQVQACDECKRWKGHSIQHSCHEHMRPFHERYRHDEFERRAIGGRARRIARDADDVLLHLGGARG